MGEREDVSKKRRKITLGGREWEVKFGFSAWERIQEDFGDITNLAEKMKTQGPSTMLTLFEVCIVVAKDEKRPSRAEIRDWLEEFDLGELLEMSKILMSCVTKSVPEATEDKASPTEAELQ
jgi:hypothetical protein